MNTSRHRVRRKKFDWGYVILSIGLFATGYFIVEIVRAVL